MEDILAVTSANAPAEDVDCMVAPKELPRGTRLRNYSIIRVLGAGGFGVTYLAREDILDRLVVIKEHFPDAYCYREAKTMAVKLRNEESEDLYAWALLAFLREVRLLATLNHVNIARVFSYFEAHGTAYYVSEYIDGMSFVDLAKDYKDHRMSIPQDSLYGCMIRLLDALHYLHQQDVLHRDIKPDNIIITKEGMPVLIDFGAAREGGTNEGGEVVESIGFSPSEQGGDSSESEEMGPWSDIYSLGATFYFILDPQAMPSSRLRERYFDTLNPLAENGELLKHYHQRLLASIDRAFAPSIAARYKSVADWIADLRAEPS